MSRAGRLKFMSHCFDGGHGTVNDLGAVTLRVVSLFRVVSSLGLSMHIFSCDDSCVGSFVWMCRCDLLL